MNISINLPTKGLTLDQAKVILGEAIHDEAAQAQTRLSYFAGLCNSLESTYQMTSDEFLVRFESGELGDDQYLFDWYAAKQGLDYWLQRYELLSKVTPAQCKSAC
jgi:hypothetical protein